jgi:hypothetical protein
MGETYIKTLQGVAAVERSVATMLHQEQTAETLKKNHMLKKVKIKAASHRRKAFLFPLKGIDEVFYIFH